MNFLLLSLCVALPSVVTMSEKQKRNACKYEYHINKFSKENNLDPALLASVIYVESGFFPRVVSNADACGLTQVIPKYTGGPETSYRKYTCKQLKDPKTSIKVGAKILSYIIKNYAYGNKDKALCMYNAGTICLKKKYYYKKSKYVKKVRKIHDTLINFR